MARHPNHRLVKIHRTYTTEEIGRLLDVHRNTVREWVKRGLPTIDDRRPMLILGRDLVEFIRTRRLKNKKTCLPGEIYCMRCRVPRRPAAEMADYQPLTTTSGNLVGICPSCESLMYRCVSLAKLEETRGSLNVKLPQAPSHMTLADLAKK